MQSSASRVIVIVALASLLMLPILVGTCSKPATPAPGADQPVSDILSAGQ